ncbi:MAG: hypothetical protein PHT84_07095 [Candidatus Pacebacteria bacterium]|nr:hypothetical protein [Candidatus Paceibacterota bacterium]
MLDYAANAVSYWSQSAIRSKYEKYCELKQIEPEIKIQEIIGEDENIEEFWVKVSTNLKAGKIRMLFVSDRIPKELQRIIEFLNEQMSPAEVLGLEIKQFSKDSLKTLVPRVVGQTASAQINKGQHEINQWTQETFFKELIVKNSKVVADIVQNIIKDFKDDITRIWYGKGKVSGSLIPVCELSDVYHYPFVIWTYGKIEIYFQWYKEKPIFNDVKKREELLKKLNDIKGLNIPQSKLDKRPSFNIDLLKNKSEYAKFIQVYKWYFSEIKK